MGFDIGTVSWHFEQFKESNALVSALAPNSTKIICCSDKDYDTYCRFLTDTKAAVLTPKIMSDILDIPEDSSIGHCRNLILMASHDGLSLYNLKQNGQE